MHRGEPSLNCLSSVRPVFTFATLFATLLPQPAVARRGSVSASWQSVARDTPVWQHRHNWAENTRLALDRDWPYFIARKQNWSDFSSVRTKLDFLLLRWEISSDLEMNLGLELVKISRRFLEYSLYFVFADSFNLSISDEILDFCKVSEWENYGSNGDK